MLWSTQIFQKTFSSSHWDLPGVGFEVGVLVKEFVEAAIVENGEKFDLAACGVDADAVADVMRTFLPIGVGDCDDLVFYFFADFFWKGL